METKPFPYILAVVAVILSLAVTSLSIIMPENASVRGKVLGENLPLSWKYIGNADQKYFFAEVNEMMNWKAADAYCKAMNMELASIESQLQHDVVKRGLEPFPNYFWTSGRESRVPSMIAWNQNGERLDETLFPSWQFRDNVTNPVYDFRYCVILRPLLNEDTFRMNIIECTYNSRVLCQGL